MSLLLARLATQPEVSFPAVVRAAPALLQTASLAFVPVVDTPVVVPDLAHVEQPAQLEKREFRTDLQQAWVGPDRQPEPHALSWRGAWPDLLLAGTARVDEGAFVNVEIAPVVPTGWGSVYADVFATPVGTPGAFVIPERHPEIFDWGAFFPDRLSVVESPRFDGGLVPVLPIPTAVFFAAEFPASLPREIPQNTNSVGVAPSTVEFVVFFDAGFPASLARVEPTPGAFALVPAVVESPFSAAEFPASLPHVEPTPSGAVYVAVETFVGPLGPYDAFSFSPVLLTFSEGSLVPVVPPVVDLLGPYDSYTPPAPVVQQTALPTIPRVPSRPVRRPSYSDGGWLPEEQFVGESLAEALARTGRERLERLRREYASQATQATKAVDREDLRERRLSLREKLKRHERQVFTPPPELPVPVSAALSQKRKNYASDWIVPVAVVAVAVVVLLIIASSDDKPKKTKRKKK